MDSRSGPTQLAIGQHSLVAPRGAAIAGVLFAVLMATSIVLVRLAIPFAGGDIAPLLAEPSRRTQVRIAVQLAPFAGIAFLWFIGVFRNRLGKLEDQFFATVFLGQRPALRCQPLCRSGVLGSARRVGRVRPDQFLEQRRVLPGAPAYRRVSERVRDQDGRRVHHVEQHGHVAHGGCPRAVAFSGYVCAAVLLLVITSWPWIALLFPAWMLLLSATILLSEFRAPAAVTTFPSIFLNPIQTAAHHFVSNCTKPLPSDAPGSCCR